MKKIEASKLNRSIKVVLDGVAKGDKYEVTRYGKVVAKILPPNAREYSKVYRIDPPLEIEVEDYPQDKLEQAIALDNDPGVLTPEQIRQKRRDYLMSQIAKPKKDG